MSQDYKLGAAIAGLRAVQGYTTRMGYTVLSDMIEQILKEIERGDPEKPRKP